MEKVNRGIISLAAYGAKPPASYQTYLDLGRFRTRFFLDEQKRRPAPALEEFIQQYSLQVTCRGHSRRRDE